MSDIDNEKFYAFERFSRGAAGLAGAEAAPFRVWIDDWEATQSGDDMPPMRVQAAEELRRLGGRRQGAPVHVRRRERDDVDASHDGLGVEIPRGHGHCHGRHQRSNFTCSTPHVQLRARHYMCHHFSGKKHSCFICLNRG